MYNENTLGTVEIKNNKAALHYTRMLSQPPKKVWEALTMPEHLTKWFNLTDAKVEEGPNGSIDFSAGSFRMTGNILSWQPEKMLEYEFNQQPSGFKTVMHWELNPADGGTALMFTHSGLDSTVNFAAGAHVVLENLDRYLSGKDMVDFNTEIEKARPYYAEWEAKS